MPSTPRPRRSGEARARAARLAELPFESFGGGSFGPIQSVVQPIRELWRRRELLGLLVRRELKVRYKDSALGFVWVLVRPLTMLLIYFLAIGKVLGADRAIPDFAIFVFTGLTLWGLYADTITQSTASILTNAGLVKKVYLPREIFPLAASGSALVNFSAQLALLVAATFALGQPPDPAKLPFALGAFFVTLLYAVSLGILLSALNVYFRDVQYLVEVALLILFWVSPIVYSWQLVRNELTGSLAWVQEVFLANPMTLAILSFQQTFWRAGAEQAQPAFLEWRLLGAFVVGLLLFWIAQRIFTRLQADFAQEV